MRGPCRRTIAATCCSRVEWQDTPRTVIAGLDPAIHQSVFRNKMDARVEPAHDELRKLRRPRQRAVDHVDRVRYPVHRDERAEARAFFLTEQHLVEHVEPVERDAGAAVLALLHGIEER